MSQRNLLIAVFTRTVLWKFSWKAMKCSKCKRLDNCNIHSEDRKRVLDSWIDGDTEWSDAHQGITRAGHEASGTSRGGKWGGKEVECRRPEGIKDEKGKLQILSENRNHTAARGLQISQETC